MNDMENNEIQNDSIMDQPAAETTREAAINEAALSDNRPVHLQTGPNHKIIPYNSDMERLKMPEYGRNIQRLLDECLKIEDRAERTRCAKTIAKIVVTLFPDHVGEGKDMKKIWDHLNMMSDFKLDIDFPVEVMDKETMSPDPAPIPYYGTGRIRRHYGRLIESMIDVVSDMPGGEEKDMLISQIANQMKKQLIIHNPEGVSDQRVINDLNAMSGGRIAIDPACYRLNEYKGLKADDPVSGKKKKQQKKVKFTRQNRI